MTRSEILAGRPNAALEVTIVGDGVQEGPGSFEAIRGAYARAGLRHVRFAGSLSHARTSELLARADIFCLPSHSEGFPLGDTRGDGRPCRGRRHRGR